MPFLALLTRIDNGTVGNNIGQKPFRLLALSASSLPENIGSSGCSLSVRTARKKSLVVQAAGKWSFDAKPAAIAIHSLLPFWTDGGLVGSDIGQNSNLLKHHQRTQGLLPLVTLHSRPAAIGDTSHNH